MNPSPGGLFDGMSIELGKVGIWRHPSGLTPEVVAEVEALGYGAIWVGGSPPGDLGVVDQLLDATDHIAVATGIVNVWKDDAATGPQRRSPARAACAGRPTPPGQPQVAAAGRQERHAEPRGYSRAVPISPFLVTRAASSSAASSWVPGGRAGSTM